MKLILIHRFWFSKQTICISPPF